MRTLLLLALTAQLSAYAAPPGARITNGQLEHPSRLSAVIYQDGCTGTFVSPTTIVTAGHCADRGFTYKGIRTRSHQSMGEYYGIPWNYDNDVRVLIFPQPVAPAWMPVVNEAVFPGLHVVIAGFGSYDMTGDGHYDGRFRYGTNLVDGFEYGGRVIIINGTSFGRVAGSEGVDSVTGPGDSGGALLWNGRLAGVTSAGRVTSASTKMSMFVNLTNPHIRAFLNAQVATQGADIRFTDEGSIPYPECMNLDSSQKVFTFVFQVPHSNISSMAGHGGASMRVFRKVSVDRNNNNYVEDNWMNSEFYTFSTPAFGAHLIIPDDQPTPSYVCFI